jgi:hypothetical protein
VLAVIAGCGLFAARVAPGLLRPAAG